jgi:hypothetical protein
MSKKSVASDEQERKQKDVLTEDFEILSLKLSAIEKNHKKPRL